MQYPQWQWGQLLVWLYWELSSYVSEVWEEPLCTAGRTGTLFPLISTPDSLFHTSAFLGTFTVTEIAPALPDLHKTSKETPLKEFLAASRIKIHSLMPDLRRQSYIGSEQQQKGYIYSATSTVQRTLTGSSNSLDSEQGVQPDWMSGQVLHLHISALVSIKLFILTLTWRAGWGYVLGGQDRAAGWLL